MKTRTYRNSSLTCKSYLKPAGNGYEVGFKFGTKLVFVGNFVKSTEANAWYTQMNKEIRLFNKRYTVSKTFPKSKYSHFLSAHLHNKYYSFVNRLVPKHNRAWNRTLQQDTRTFAKLAKKASPKERRPFLKAA